MDLFYKEKSGYFSILVKNISHNFVSVTISIVIVCISVVKIVHVLGFIKFWTLFLLPIPGEVNVII